jgi:hypothetical protein
MTDYESLKHTRVECKYRNGRRSKSTVSFRIVIKPSLLSGMVCSFLAITLNNRLMQQGLELRPMPGAPERVKQDNGLIGAVTITPYREVIRTLEQMREFISQAIKLHMILLHPVRAAF